jgi:hypothetical protein
MSKLDKLDDAGSAEGNIPAAPSARAPAAVAKAKPAAKPATKPATKPAAKPAAKPLPTPKAVICPAADPVPRFADMWRGFPEGHPSQERWERDIVEQGIVLARKGDLKYPDQCAIKLSVALHAGGVDMSAYPGAATMIAGKRAALRAAELAAWLNTQAFCGLPLSLAVTGADWKEKIARRSGIIYFANYWRRSGESAPTGDHIDLWNQSTLSPSLQSFFRFRLGIERIPNPFELLRGQPGNWYSNLDEATEILLWELA